MADPGATATLAVVAQASGVTDSTVIGFYLVYAAVAVGLVVYLAWTLQRNGAVFLRDVFDDEQVAASVNRLLVIGFYLFNLGFALLLFQLRSDYPGVISAFNQLVSKLGTLLLSLGVLHLINMAVFWRFRANRNRETERRNTPSGLIPPPPLPAWPAPAPTLAPTQAPSVARNDTVAPT